MFGLGTKKISSFELYNLIEQKGKYILLDVRRPDEFSTGHIKTAKNIPNYRVDGKIINKLKNKEDKIILYCHSGSRARGTARKLKKFGYTNVLVLGGLMNWQFELTKK